MIRYLEKLPDTAIGLLAAGAVWFGFNYVTLGARALERYSHAEAMPACMETIEAKAAGTTLPKLGFGDLFNMPELDKFESDLIELYTPRALSMAQKLALCECAVSASSATLRFDYALSTASFRLFTPDSIAGLRSKTVGVLSSGACGSIPGAE
jgi:hypothetical protein